MDAREAERKLDEWVNDDDLVLSFDEKREIRNAIDWERTTLRARHDRAVALLRKAAEYAEEKKTDNFTPYFAVEFIDYTDMEKIRALLAEEE